MSKLNIISEFSFTQLNSVVEEKQSWIIEDVNNVNRSLQMLYCFKKQIQKNSKSSEYKSKTNHHTFLFNNAWTNKFPWCKVGWCTSTKMPKMVVTLNFFKARKKTKMMRERKTCLLTGDILILFSTISFYDFTLRRALVNQVFY